MKHDAIIEQGIPIHERVPIPDELIPEDGKVEIDAKIHAGYFTTGKIMNIAELSEVQYVMSLIRIAPLIILP